MHIEQVGDVRCALAEGPVWDVAEQALYFTDMTGQRLWRWDRASGTFRHWETPALIGSFALRESGGAVMALANGFHLFDFETGLARFIADPQAAGSETQFNDGKADQRGRFVAGTVHKPAREPRGALYRLDPDRTVTQLDSGITISNGPCWSPDGSVLYFADSIPCHIYAYDYDLNSGDVSNRRVFADTRALGGIPDGATVDAEGRVWSAICGGGKVACWRPDGVLEEVIDVPPQLASSVMFGGPGLDELYVTSIDRATLAGADIEGVESRKDDDDPGGRLFVVTDLGVKGLAEPRYAG